MNGPATTTRRGFVLPVVILLVVMVGAVAAIMLQRHVARAKTVQRQMVAYQEHHGVQSLQTLIEAWRKTPNAQPRQLADMLEADGLAFTLDPGDGTSIRFYLFPGQDQMLRRVTGLRPEDRAAAEAALEYLAQTVEDPELRERMLRHAGPLAVDVNIAPPQVIAAIVHAIVGDGPEARAYERALIDARLTGEPIKLQTLSNIATEAGVETEQRTLLGRFFTVSPDLWRFRVDVREARSAERRRPLSQYAGLIQLGQQSSTTAGGGFEEPTPFLTWEKLNPDDPRAVE